MQSGKLFDKRPREKKTVRIAQIPTYLKPLDPLHNNNARSLAQHLYLKGAKLLNDGILPSSQTLIDEYHQLPKFDAEYGNQSASNPLHAIFIIKVALDDMNANDILTTFLNLKHIYSHKKIDNTKIDFPNVSEWFNELGLLQLMRAYILHHPARIQLTRESYKSVNDEYAPKLNSYSALIGNVVTKENDRQAVERILCYSPPKQTSSDAERILRRMKPRVV